MCPFVVEVGMRGVLAVLGIELSSCVWYMSTVPLNYIGPTAQTDLELTL